MHQFCLQYGHPKALTEFETQMISIWDTTDYPNHPGYASQINYRKVGFYTILVEPEFAPLLEQDLWPYNSIRRTSPGLKKNLFKLIGLIPAFIGMKPVEDSYKKKVVERPTWRYFMTFFVVGYKEVMEGNKHMLKYGIFVESQRKYHAEYFDWLEKRDFATGLPNKPGMITHPIVSEIRFYDISVFSSCEKQLLRHLSPYQPIDDVVPSWMARLFRLGRKLFNIRSPHSTDVKTYHSQPSGRNSMKIYLLGSLPDPMPKDPDYVPVGEHV